MSRKVFPNQRIIFLVLYYNNGWHIGHMSVAGNSTIREAVAQRIEWATWISEAIGRERKIATIPNSHGYYFYDWELKRLEPAMRVRELPKPCVLFAFPVGHGLRISQQARDSSEPYDEQKESWLLAYILKSRFPVVAEKQQTLSARSTRA